jgi:hypothetical protein
VVWGRPTSFCWGLGLFPQKNCFNSRCYTGVFQPIFYANFNSFIHGDGSIATRKVDCYYTVVVKKISSKAYLECMHDHHHLCSSATAVGTSPRWQWVQGQSHWWGSWDFVPEANGISTVNSATL